MPSHATQLQAKIDTLMQQAAFEDAIQLCKPALRQARQRRDPRAEAVTYLGLAESYQYLGEFKEARLLVDGAIDHAQAADAPELVVQALNLSGSIHMSGTYQTYEAEDDYRAALRLAYDIDDSHGTATALNGIATALNSMGNADRAQRYAREAFELARDIDDSEQMVVALTTIGSALYSNDNYEKAQKCYEDALAISQQADLRLQEGLLIGNLGLLHTQREHEFTQGIEMLEAALDIAQETNCVPHEFLTLYWLGAAWGQQGDYDRAHDCYEQMLNRAQTWRNRAYEATAFYNLGTLHYHEAKFDEAIADYQQAASISRETMNPFHEAQAEQAIAAAYYADRRYDDALQHFMMARTLYDALDNTTKVRSVTVTIIMTYIARLVDKILRWIGIRTDSTSPPDVDMLD